MSFPRLLLVLAILALNTAGAQQITGIWKGRINGVKTDVKIVQQGDSLKGTSYYFDGPGSYRRYSIKGYFDSRDNSVVWWDDELLESKGNNAKGIQAVADFNCPGGGVMKLDGKAKTSNREVAVHLTKEEGSQFKDEWDFVIDNYTVGANDPELIDSVSRIAHSAPPVSSPAPPVAKRSEPKQPVFAKRTEPLFPKKKPQEPLVKEQPTVVAILPPKTISQKFTERSKTLIREIPIQGDSLELRFYDNAEIDGDSITVYLNDQMLFTHVRLTGNAYSVKVATTELKPGSELVMVAENLGSIPPNTSYMVALMGKERYEATLASTENSSAMIRFTKAP